MFHLVYASGLKRSLASSAKFSFVGSTTPLPVIELVSEEPPASFGSSMFELIWMPLRKQIDHQVFYAPFSS